MPPRGVQGGISDAWQRTIPGTESPGTYLVLAPGQKAPDNVAGYTVRQSPTFNIFLGVRLTDPDPERAKEALAQLADVSLRATRQSAEDGHSRRGHEDVERPAAARDGILGAAR